MLNLEIDIETFSSVNLAKAGVYRYAESPDFEVLLLGYSVDGGEVKSRRSCKRRENTRRSNECAGR